MFNHFKKTTTALTFLSLALCYATATQGVTVIKGDNDGYGFASTAGLKTATGSDADSNGDGKLSPGEHLPDLDGDSATNPGVSDQFDNRQITDPVYTDVGVILDSILIIEFDYAIPPGQAIYNATFSIVVGDASKTDEDFHVISIDGVSTGQIINPRYHPEEGDGLITITVVQVDEAFFPLLMDGQALISISYDVMPDDVAIDYASLMVNFSGDFDDDNDVDGNDFLMWQRGEVSNPPSADDLTLWQTQFGTTSPATTVIPEPTTILLVMLGMTSVCCYRRRR